MSKYTIIVLKLVLAYSTRSKQQIQSFSSGISNIVRTDIFYFGINDSDTIWHAEMSYIFLPSAYFFQILMGYKTIEFFYEAHGRLVSAAVCW